MTESVSIQCDLRMGASPKMMPGGITAGIGDELCIADVIPLKLGQTVNRLPKRPGRLMPAIPRLIGCRGMESEVRAQIDDLPTGLKKIGAKFHGDPMGKGEKDEYRQDRQPRREGRPCRSDRSIRKIRIDFGYRNPGKPPGGRRHDLSRRDG